MRRAWSRGNSDVINIQQRFRLVIYETLAMAQLNQMRERYAQALYLSAGFGDFFQ